MTLIKPTKILLFLIILIFKFNILNSYNNWTYNINSIPIENKAA